MSKKRLQDYIATNDSCWMKTYAHWSHFFSLLFLNLLLNLFFNMAVTRSQLENLSKDELINRLLQVEKIEDKLEHLNKWFENFLRKCSELHSELQVSRRCSNLRNWVIKLEKMHLVQHSTLEGLSIPILLFVYTVCLTPIRMYSQTNLDDSIDSGNFSVRGYLPLMWKDSGTHMHGLCSLC